MSKWLLGPDAPEDWVASLGLPEGATEVEVQPEQELALQCAGWITDSTAPPASPAELDNLQEQ